MLHIEVLTEETVNMALQGPKKSLNDFRVRVDKVITQKKIVRIVAIPD